MIEYMEISADSPFKLDKEENKSLSSKLFITNDKRLPVVLEKHVKEFIKDIKKCPMGIPWEDWIDEKAGKELI